MGIMRITRALRRGSRHKGLITAMFVYHAKIDRAKLAAMSENERVLMLLLAHASNEINVLQKLLLMIRKDDPPSPIINDVEAGQAFIFIRLRVGKLHEAWELFRIRVQSDRAICRTILPKLPPFAAASLSALKRHFGQGSALTAIRNNVSFHYADKANLIEASFQQLPANEPLQFYLTQTVGNSFYHAGELVAQMSALALVKAPPPAGPHDTSSAEARAFGALCDEIIQVAGDMTELFGTLIAFLSEDVIDSANQEILPDGPKVSQFSLPYFFDENDSLKVSTISNEQQPWVLSALPKTT